MSDKTADRSAALDAILGQVPVIPVLVIEDAAQAVPLAPRSTAGHRATPITRSAGSETTSAQAITRRPGASRASLPPTA